MQPILRACANKGASVALTHRRGIIHVTSFRTMETGRRLQRLLRGLKPRARPFIISAIASGKAWGRHPAPRTFRNGEQTRLSSKDVAQIRRMARKGIQATKIAAAFNISKSHAHAVARGLFWKDHPEPTRAILDRSGTNSVHSSFTEADVRQIRRLAAEGHSKVSLGRRFNADASTISRIVLRNTYRNVT